MIYQHGNTQKDYLGSGEMLRLIREFARWRHWNWSVWTALALSAMAGLGCVLELFDEGGARPSWAVLALRAVPALVLLPFAAFHQFLFSRFTLPPLMRLFGVPGSLMIFAISICAVDSLTGVPERILRERIVFHCLTGEQGLKCRELMRANPGALAMFDEEEKLQIRLHSDPARRFFADLDESHRHLVEDLYSSVLDAYSQKDYALMAEKVARILVYVDEFKDTRSYEAIARRGVAQLAEERRRRAVEERRGMIRRQVEALEGDGDRLLHRARRNARVRMQLDTLISDIFLKEPDNRKAAEWKRQLAEWDRKDSRGLASAGPKNVHRRAR